ncbi:GNAT family N-acetyltransferase [Sphingomonas morindae]|uniref:GNAT family N-acetyltransferase n=1 Tax=Sphingomonas morindae TaxID=1541170 RepID=A0ABY4X712_9SPHN|nr:GNAT family N-acetyltransferase [Sphingomonas morindae]USI72681.1 GNAT family N-acetyltransferase [Sphingomonas morindae]
MIETARLRLRFWTEADRPAYHALCAAPEVMAHLGGPQAPAEADPGFERMLASQAAHGHGFWGVERRSDDALLGLCGVKYGRVGPILDRLEIGWRLRADAWGQGYAREAATASLAWAAAHRPGEPVYAITVPANRASWGLMTRLGMRRRPDLDFDHPDFAPGHPLRAHIVYQG